MATIDKELKIRMTWQRSVRLRFVMWVARQLRVPIDVHGSYFYKNLCKMATGAGRSI